MINTTGSSHKTTIVMVALDRDKTHRHITSAALGNIQMYTDREDYEMILIDNEPTMAGELNNKYQEIVLDHHVIIDDDIGVSASRNLGASMASSDSKYFAFIDNDVFVWEGWLPKMRAYIESGEWDAVWPHQCRTTREYVKRTYEEGSDERGNDDAGLILISKEAFEKTGGWDDRFFSVYHDLAFRKRMGKAGLRVFCTNRVIITHLNGATTFNLEEFDEKMAMENQFINEKI